jgi:hypothetical protein
MQGTLCWIKNACPALLWPRRFTEPKALVAGATSGGAQAPRGGYMIGAPLSVGV